jgi:multidrug transporter EmrE-like cation transporter
VSIVDHDYGFLTEQIRDWQERRFTILTGTVTLAVAIVSFVLSQKDIKWARSDALSLLLLLLMCASLLTWYSGWSNQTMGTFLQVFESDVSRSTWQSANAELKRMSLVQRSISLNRLFAFIYAVCAGVCGALLWKRCDARSSPLSTTVCIVVAILFLISLVLLVQGAFDTDWYVNSWRSIRASTANPSNIP